MTIKVLGNWERAWVAPFNEWDLWIHPIKEFGINELSMVPVTGLEKGNLSEYSDISEALAQNSDLVHVYIDEAATTNLVDFSHPENALYIVGKTSYSPYATNYREGTDLAVKIPTVNNSGGFWSHQAISLVLYDRYLKNGF